MDRTGKALLYTDKCKRTGNSKQYRQPERLRKLYLKLGHKVHSPKYPCNEPTSVQSHKYVDHSPGREWGSEGEAGEWENGVSEDGKILVAFSNMSDGPKLTTGAPAYWSDVMPATALEILTARKEIFSRDDGLFKDVGMIVQHNCCNGDWELAKKSALEGQQRTYAEDIIEYNWDRDLRKLCTLVKDEWLRPLPSGKNSKDSNSDFATMERTPNARGIKHMLQDHPNLFGEDVEVVAILINARSPGMFIEIRR